MKSTRLFWGVFFVILGLFLLAQRFDIVCLDLGGVWRFWPLILIFVGAGLLFRSSPYRWILVSLGAVCGALLLASVVGGIWCWNGPGPEGPGKDQQLSVGARSGVELASFRFEGGAGTISIMDGEGGLVEASTRTNIGEYILTYDSSGVREDVSLLLQGSRQGWHFGKLENSVDVKLHTGPVWELDLDMGASSVDLDLRRLAVDRLRLDCGVSSSTIRLGDRAAEAEVEVNAGASTIRIEVPEHVGCRVVVEGGLSSKRLSEFQKIGKGEYETENFATAEKRINLYLHTGVSSVRVTRYRSL